MRESIRNYEYTYIIGHYNPSVRIIDLVSHTTYVVCVNFIHKWRDLLFKVDSKRQIFWETFHGSFKLLSEFITEICWEEIAEEILFVFRFDVWPGTRTLAFRLISRHTNYYTTATYYEYVSSVLMFSNTHYWALSPPIDQNNWSVWLASVALLNSSVMKRRS